MLNSDITESSADKAISVYECYGAELAGTGCSSRLCSGAERKSGSRAVTKQLHCSRQLCSCLLML